MFHGTCFVLHQPGEGQFGISRPVFCLSPPPMKDNLALSAQCFVFHRLNEGQFGVIGPVFCLSSPR